MDTEVIVRRVVPGDNSCLFRAVGYVMQHDRNKPSMLRQVVAQIIASDPDHYNEAFLGKTNEEYCAWIREPRNWGGAIELSILADCYNREIAVYDIQTTRCHLYGQGKGYEERVMLIYDGSHYDALAMSPCENASEESDITLFPVDRDGNIGVAQALAESLVEETNRQRNFRDTANFTLRCAVCQQGAVVKRKLWNMPQLLVIDSSKDSDGRCSFPSNCLFSRNHVSLHCFVGEE